MKYKITSWVLILSMLSFFLSSGQTSSKTTLDNFPKVKRIYGGLAGLTVPQGYIFLDGDDAEAFAKEIQDDGYNSNRIGYLIHSRENGEEMIPILGILDCYDTGHIIYPNSMITDEWKQLLMKLSNCSEESNLNFLWTPVTNHDSHATSIGYSVIDDDGLEKCAANVFIPTKDGFWQWYVRFPKEYREQAKVICELLANDTSLDYQLKHENFNPSKSTIKTYNLYLDFFNEEPSNESKSTSTKAIKNPLAAIQFLKVKETAYIGLILLGAIGIIGLIFLFVIKTNSNKRKADETTEKYFTRCTRNIKARLRLFASIYAAYILLSIYLIVALFYGTVFLITGLFNGWIVFAFIFSIYSIPLDIFVVVCIAGIWYGAITLLRVLIKPIIVHNNLKNSDSKKQDIFEITSSDSPELFKLIKETTAECGVAFPEKVYLSLSMNAAAMYDNPIDGIKNYKSPKSLIIGLPFINILSILELKAVIAHEFGHFAQKSTSELTAVWYTRNNIGKLLYFDTSESKRYDNWLSHSNSIWRGVGKLTYWIISKVCIHIYNLYEKMTQSSNEMSREMELDADRMSAKIVGSDIAITTLTKIDAGCLAYTDFNVFVEISINEHSKMPNNIMESFTLLLPFLLRRHDITIVNNGIIKESSIMKISDSRVEIINEWDTHPDTETRIENLKNFNQPNISDNHSPAELLLPKETEKTAEKHLVYSHLSDKISIISNEEFKNISLKELDTRSFPKYLKPFFNRELHIRPNGWPHEGKYMERSDWDIAEKTIGEYLQAVTDYDMLIKFKEGLYGSRRMKYLGKDYNRKNVPIEEHIQYLRRLEKEIEDIDMQVMAHAMACANDVDMIKQKYLEISHSQKIIASMHHNFDKPFDWLRKFYMSPGYVTTEESVILSQDIQAIEQNFKEFIRKEVNFSVLAPVINNVLYNEVISFIQSPSSLRSVNDTSQANIMFKLFEYLENTLRDLIYFHSRNICAVIEGKSQQDFIENSLASTHR